MHTKAPHEQFYRYVIPAMASQLLTGFFIIVDGFFIGQSIGDVGLASINILWPIAAVILATGLGIGSGGSVVMTHAMGAGDTEKALAARGNTLLCLGAATVLLAAGQSGMRLALPSSRIMVHQPSGGFRGQARDAAIHTTEMLRLRAVLDGILAAATGLSQDEAAALTDRDTYLSAREAVELGLVDGVVRPIKSFRE